MKDKVTQEQWDERFEEYYETLYPKMKADLYAHPDEVYYALEMWYDFLNRIYPGCLYADYGTCWIYANWVICNEVITTMRKEGLI